MQREVEIYNYIFHLFQKRRNYKLTNLAFFALLDNIYMLLYAPPHPAYQRLEWAI